jgi:hypothetical protein
MGWPPPRAPPPPPFSSHPRLLHSTPLTPLTLLAPCTQWSEGGALAVNTPGFENTGLALATVFQASTREGEGSGSRCAVVGLGQSSFGTASCCSRSTFSSPRADRLAPPSPPLPPAQIITLCGWEFIMYVGRGLMGRHD